jgi:hypothetical protein
VFDDLELSHCESRFLSLAIIPWAEEDPTHLDRHPTGNDGLTCPCKRLVPGRIAYPAFTKTTNGRTGIRQAVEKSLALAAPQAIRSRHLVLGATIPDYRNDGVAGRPRKDARREGALPQQLPLQGVRAIVTTEIVDMKAMANGSTRGALRIH